MRQPICTDTIQPELMKEKIQPELMKEKMLNVFHHESEDMTTVGREIKSPLCNPGSEC